MAINLFQLCNRVIQLVVGVVINQVGNRQKLVVFYLYILVGVQPVLEKDFLFILE